MTEERRLSKKTIAKTIHRLRDQVKIQTKEKRPPPSGKVNINMKIRHKSDAKEEGKRGESNVLSFQKTEMLKQLEENSMHCLRERLKGGR